MTARRSKYHNRLSCLAGEIETSVGWEGRPRLLSANLVADIVTLTKSDYVTVSSLPLSLNSRIGLLRKRRRNSVLKQLLAVTAPVLIGVALLLLVAAGGVVASAR
jgi:hypothetical protein